MNKAFNVITGLILALATVWVIGFTAPRLYEIYKDRNTEIRHSTDTLISTDTIYLEKTFTDTVPKTLYQTVTKRDTIYRVIGDSIEQTPRVIWLKKKLSKEALTWEDRIRWFIMHI